MNVGTCKMEGREVCAFTRFGVFRFNMPRFEPYSPELLKALREEKGLKTQQDFADASGIGVNTVKRLEAGMVRPNEVTLAKIGRFYGLYIYADWNEETPGD